MVSGNQIKAAPRKIWIYLYHLGRLRPHWNGTDLVVRSCYVSEMRLAFPELRLCELDCKSHRIATLSYPGWFRTSSAKHVSKVDPDDLDEQASAVVSGTKRKPSQGPDDERATKKMKTKSKKHVSAPVSAAAPSVPPSRPSLHCQLQFPPPPRHLQMTPKAWPLDRWM